MHIPIDSGGFVDPTKKKKAEKLSTNKEFHTKSIKSYFQFNDPTLNRTKTIRTSPRQQRPDNR